MRVDHRESAREEKGVRLIATSVWIIADCFHIGSGSHAESPAIYRTKPVDPSGQGAQLAVLPGLSLQPTGFPMGSIL